MPLTVLVLKHEALRISDKLLKTAYAEDTRKRLSNFAASNSWVQAFISRKGLRSVRLHDEGASFDIGKVAREISKLRRTPSDFEEEFIFNMNGTGLFKLFAKRSYVLPSEVRDVLRGTKDMKANARVSIYVCTNATGTLKVPLAFIGKSKTPRCFRKGLPPVSYFTQISAWSDTATFQKWFYLVFVPFVRKRTSKKVALVMDNCRPHGVYLLDPTEQVSVITLLPNCTSMFQPMDMRTIACLKVRCRSMLLQRMLEVFENRSQLREVAKKLAAGLKGLDEVHDPHVLDVAEMLEDVWESVAERTIYTVLDKFRYFTEMFQRRFDE